MKNKVNRIFAFIISLTMMASLIVIPESAYAKDSGNYGTVSPDRANLSFVYLGKTAAADAVDTDSDGVDNLTATNDKLTAKTSMDTFEPGDYIWIGVQASNLSKVRDIFKSDQKGTAEGGVASATFSFWYDTTYLQPYEYNSDLITYCINEQYPTPASYTVDGAEALGGEIPDAATAETPVINDNLDAYIINIGQTGSARANQRRLFHDVSATSPIGDEPVMLAMVAFKVLDQGDGNAPSAGSKAIQGALSGERLAMHVGFTSATDPVDLQWVADQSQNPDYDATNLKNYFNITDANGQPSNGTIDVFPTSYSIKFYTDENCTAEIPGGPFGASGILGGTSMATLKADTTKYSEPVVGTNFDETITEGGQTKYFTEFKYIASDNTAKSYDELATVSDAAAAPNGTNPGTEIKVYPAYDNHEILLHYTNPTPGSSEETKPFYIAPGTDADPSYMAAAPTTGTAAVDGIDFVVPSGYALEWYTQPNGGGDKVVFGTDATATPLHNVTDLYAKVIKGTTVTFQKFKTSSDTDNVIKTEVIMPEKTGSDRALAAPADPTKDGYTFVKWVYEKVGDSTTKADFVPKGQTGETQFAADDDGYIVYGEWNRQITVKYYPSATDAANGTNQIGTDDEIETGDNFTAPAVDFDETNEKFFKEWKNAADNNVVDTDSTLTSTLADSVGSDGVLKLYAEMEDAIKVEFYEDKDVSGNPITLYHTGYIDPNATSKKLPADQFPSTNPTKTGDYYFSEWRYNVAPATDYATKFDGDVEVTGPAGTVLKVVAEYSDLATITFKKNVHGDTTPDSTIKVESGKKVSETTGVTVPDNPTRTDGYTFKGWSTESNGSTGILCVDKAAVENYTFTASKTLYAQWEPTDSDNDVTLTFNKNGGPSSLTLNPETVLVNPNAPGNKVYDNQIPTFDATIDNYRFDGWYKSASYSDKDAIDFTTAGLEVTEDTTVYAHWTYVGTDKVEVKFHPNYSGATDPYITMAVAPNSAITSAQMPAGPDRTSDGYSFDDWNTVAGGTGTTYTNAAGIANVGTTTPLDLYAQYSEVITIHYNENGGTVTTALADAKQPKTTVYTDPSATEMAKMTAPTGPNGSYTFVGWYTNPNGSGDPIKADNTLTFEGVANASKTNPTDPMPNEVTLYARWEAVTSPAGDPLTPDPDQKSVAITFNGNGTTNYPVTKEADPSPKYVQLDGKLLVMPADPVRTGYTFLSWNTKADGTGETVDTNKVINKATLGDGVITPDPDTNPTGTYAMTLYAQWEVTNDADEVIVNLHKNTDGKNGGGVITRSVHVGDTIGTVPQITNGNREFMGWFKSSGTEADGTIVFTGNKLEATDVISTTATTVDYYAQWKVYLYAEIVSNTYGYTGSQIKPKFKIYEATKSGEGMTATYAKTGDPIYGDPDGGDLSESGCEYEVTFRKGGSTVAAADVKNVGDYAANIVLKDGSSLKSQGAEVMYTDGAFSIEKKQLAIEIKPDTQIQKAGGTINPIGLRVMDGTTEVTNTHYTVTYYKWNDSETGDNADGKVQSLELDAGSTTVPSDIGKYVVKVALTATDDYNVNYSFSGTGPWDTTDPVYLFNGTTYGADEDARTYPAYNSSGDGDGEPQEGDSGTTYYIPKWQQIVFEIESNDPSASNISVQKVNKDTSAETPVDLTKDDYTTSKMFVGDETTETDTTKKNHYWVRIDKDSKEVVLTIEPMYAGTTPTVKVGTTQYTPTADGSNFKVTVPITNDGATATDIVVTMTAAGDNPPTRDYTITVQKLKDIEIDLNPGNSPYGLMERMSTKYGHAAVGAWDDAKIATAKEKFDQSHSMNKTYHPDYEPEKAQTELDYTKIAWQVKSGSSFVDGTNYDEDAKAIFIYESSQFVDPGLTLYGQDGKKIDSPTITKALTLKKLTAAGVPTFDDNEGVDEAISEKDVDGVKKYDLSGKIYRPGVYEMVYTISYKDLNDGTTKTQTINRPVIMLSRRGDVQLTPSVLHNSNDATNLKNNWSKLKSRSMLFSFRTADLQITPSPLMNSNDATTLKNNWSKMKTAQQYYDISVIQ